MSINETRHFLRLSYDFHIKLVLKKWVKRSIIY